MNPIEIAISDVLDANRAPLETVQDMADALEDFNPEFDRSAFITSATARLVEDLETQADMLIRARTRGY